MRFGDMYGYGALNADEVIEKALKTTLKRRKFDSIVGVGLSGALVIPQLAKALDRTFAIIRKSTESAHSRYPIEGEIGESWIFVDDLIQSGATYRMVRDAVSKGHKMYHGSTPEPKYKGTWTYGSNRGDWYPITVKMGYGS